MFQPGPSAFSEGRAHIRVYFGVGLLTLGIFTALQIAKIRRENAALRKQLEYLQERSQQHSNALHMQALRTEKRRQRRSSVCSNSSSTSSGASSTSRSDLRTINSDTSPSNVNKRTPEGNGASGSRGTPNDAYPSEGPPTATSERSFLGESDRRGQPSASTTAAGLYTIPPEVENDKKVKSKHHHHHQHHPQRDTKSKDNSSLGSPSSTSTPPQTPSGFGGEGQGKPSPTTGIPTPPPAGTPLIGKSPNSAKPAGHQRSYSGSSNHREERSMRSVPHSNSSLTRNNRSDGDSEFGSQTLTSEANDTVGDFLEKKRRMDKEKIRLLKMIPTFKDADERFFEGVSDQLHHDHFAANTVLYCEGEVGDVMYFLASGHCEAVRQGKFFRRYSEGTYFGEVSVLQGTLRPTTVTTKTPCDVFCLAMEAFLEVIKDHPQVRDAMEKEVYRRFEEAKYDLSQRKDPQIRQLITQAVEREFAMMKAKRSQKIKWQLNKKIGSGAAGSVYSAIDLSTGRPIAVKVLNIAGAKSTLLLSIQQESELMLRLRHPNLVEGYGMEKDDDGNQLYILMELLPMGSIQKVLKEFGPLSEQATRLYARQMLSGLLYLHKHGVLHRDIKPGNMLISAQGVVKLTDFGIARYGTFLDTATISGTPAYLSPDAICGKYSIASDIWAMGCSILEMVTRQVPWSELNFEASTQLLFHVGSGKVTPQLPSVASSPTDYEQAGAISPQLHSLLSQMLALDPAMRGDCASILQHEFFTCPEEQLPWQPNRLQRVIQRGTNGDVDSLQSLTETADDSPRRTYPG